MADLFVRILVGVLVKIVIGLIKFYHQLPAFVKGVGRLKAFVKFGSF